jgi:hypothetical protein
MGQVAHTGERSGNAGFLVGKPEGKNHIVDLDLDGRITLKWILKKQDGRA